MGNGGLHLDNQEHAILEHCVIEKKIRTPTPKATPSLEIMLSIDEGHFKNAKAHLRGVLVQLEDPETVCFSWPPFPCSH